MDRSLENSDDEIDNIDKKQNDLLDKISADEDDGHDDESDIDEVLKELKIKENKTAIEDTLKAKEDLNKSSEEIIDTTK